MSRHILVVTDQVQGGWLAEAGQVASPTQWHLMILSLSASRYLRENVTALQGLDYTVIPLEKYAGEAQRDLHGFYSDFVYHFPRYVKLNGVTLLDLLRQPGDVNLWWLGETCEKGPLRGPLPRQLYALALLRHILNDHQFNEIWLYLSCEDLRACAKKGLSSAGLTVRSFTVRSTGGMKRWLVEGQGPFLLLRQLVWHTLVVLRTFLNRLVLKASGIRAGSKNSRHLLVGLFSRYPILWRNPYSMEQEERYFVYLAAWLRRHAEVSYLVTISDWPWQLWRHRRHMCALFDKQNIQALALYLTTADFLRVLFGAGLMYRFLRYKWRMASSVRVEFLGWNISQLWDAEIRRTLTGPDIPDNLLLASAVRRITKRLNVRLLMNPLEFQPMERAIWAGTHGHAATVAIQHSTFCRNHFMYFFKEGELGTYLREGVADPSPLPDYYVVAGTLPCEIMLRNGVPPERMGLCGAIRYNNLMMEEIDAQQQQELRDKLGIPKHRPTVLVATSISWDESIDLVESLAQVASYFDGQVTFLFKCHYHCRIEDHIAKLFALHARHLEYRILDVDGPLYEYIRAADAVLLSGSTVALEALALGRFLIIYHNPGLLNLTPVAEFPGSALLVSTPDALSEALRRWVSNEIDSDQFLAARVEVIRQVFYRLDGRADERVASFLQDKGLL